jgi:hypothetical protein
MTQDPKHIALAYIEACSSKNFPALADLLAPNVAFAGPGNAVTGAEPYTAIIRRLAPIWVRSDIKKVFVDGNDVAVVYDFVTSTAAGSLAIVEWLKIAEGRVASIQLLFDRVAFKPAGDELARAASHASGPSPSAA